MRRGLIAALTVTSALVLPALPATAVQSPHTLIVNDVPSTQTPEIKDGRVLTIAKVGSKVILGGTFTMVSNRGSGTVLSRANILAFDAVSGAVDTAFAPSINGVVNTLLPGPNNTVYAGGTFTSVNGATQRNLTYLNAATGSVVTGFKAAALNGAVNDLSLSGGRLFVGGTFSTAGGVGHGGLVTLVPSTGALDPYMTIDVAVNHNYPSGNARASVGVSKLDITPDGGRLVAIGNFKLVEGQSRDQAVIILLPPSGPVVDPNWRTARYEPACFSNAFDSYIRDIDIAPDGSWFSIVATGGPNPGTLCDTATRWEFSDTGADVQPRWIADTGGDTLFSVAITGPAVYVGGHQRWLNNAGGRDFAAPGSVPRPGLAALDPLNGVPLSWNPGRQPRGVGAQALLATPDGLYVGSDTDYIGNVKYFRPKIAFFPLAGGTTPVSQDTGTLPANVFLAGRPTATGSGGGAGPIGVDDVAKRYYTGTTVSPTSVLPPAGIQWSRARGGFMANGKLVYGLDDNNLYTRTFDGTSFGPAVLVDPYNDPFWSDINTGSGQTYRGVKPSFYGELSSVTGMFYAGGRVYYSRSGQQGMFSRGMSLDSLIVAPEEQAVPGTTGWADAQGMFLSGGNLYWASRVDGNLRRVAFTNGAPSGASTVVSGPTVDGTDWRTRVMFLGPGGPPPPNQPPSASFTSSCTGLTCSFDASTSADPDGSIVGYSWRFGDSSTGSGVSPSHTYGSAGARTVTLTVTDNNGATGSTSNAQPVTANRTITFRAAATPFTGTGVNSAALTVPSSIQAGDALVLALTTNSAVSGAAPAGYSLVGTQSSGNAVTTQVWQRVATAGDAGATVRVALSGAAKVDLSLVAYAGTRAAAPVLSFTGDAEVGGSSHTTPTATAPDGAMVVSVWNDKSSTARQFTAPDGVSVRTSVPGNGNRDIATLVADGGAPVAAGPVGGLTATVNAPSARSTMLTLVLAAGS
ncbi:MAG: PKD domain-containing protein [Geodermatophilaceae bacterium]